MCSDDINRYNARVGGPPVGAEDEEGFDVGDQALGNLRSGGRFTACQPGKSVAAHLQTWGQCRAGNRRLDSWELLLGEGYGATPLSAEANEYAPFCVNIASMS